LWANGPTSNTLTLSKQVYAFGFEIEPNPRQLEPISVNFVLMSGPTVVGVISRSVDGNGGARLIAGRSTAAFDRVEITSQADFAIAQIRYSLNTNVATQTVPAGQSATVTAVQNNEPVAGISVPTGGFADDVDLTVSLSPAPTALSAAATAMCHAYLLNQTGQCLTVTAIRKSDGQHAIVRQPVTIGVCLPAVLHVEFFKFENPQDRPVVLKQVPAGFLPCDAAVHHASAAPPSNWLDGFARGLVKQVGGLLTPKPLYAGHAGFGGIVPVDGPLSIFTWAAPVQVSSAALAVNVLNSGKDGFALAGTFSLPTTGFDALNDAVTVGFGTSVYTIPAGSFRWVAAIKRWAYVGKYTTGITAMTINPLSGAFTVAATLPTEGPAPTGTSTIFRPFSIQIGQRAQGVGLKCSATDICQPQETP
jgi:hypothetical protein